MTEPIENTPQTSASNSSTPSTSVSSPEASHSNNLHPSMINYRDITDKTERENALTLVGAWYEEIKKDVHALLTKHGVIVYEIGFRHEGSGRLMVIDAGHPYVVAKLSVAVTHELQGRAMEDLEIDPTAFVRQPPR